MTGLRVVKSGILALLQDHGRFGLASVGITTGGPMDSLAYDWANRLCDNSSGAVAIELTLGGLVLEAQVHSCIAVTGATLPFTINGMPVDMWRSYRIKPGDQLAFGFVELGCRSYIAVKGGFLIEPQLGSVATVVREALGGLSGGPLQKGDWLACGDYSQALLYQLPKRFYPHYRRDIRVRVVVGYQANKASDQLLACFFAGRYRVSAACDRMGYRLMADNEHTEQLRCLNSFPESMLSEGITLGAIQLPPDGQPIVLMRDHQTIGGYPKLGAVLSIDLAKLAQLVAGDTVQFQAISVDDARQQLLITRHFFQTAEQQLQPLE